MKRFAWILGIVFVLLFCSAAFAAPYFLDRQPVADAYSNNALQQVSVRITSDSNINTGQTRINVEGTDYAIGDSHVSWNAGTIIFTPTVAFADKQVVNVTVYSADTAGNSDNSSWAFTIDLVQPNAVNGFSAYADNGKVSLYWSAAFDETAGIDHYILYKDTSTISDTGAARVSKTNVFSTAFTDFTVDRNSTYYYKVAAVDRAGNVSVASGEKSVFVPDSFNFSQQRVSIEPSFRQASIGSRDSLGLGYVVKNNSDTQACITISVSPYSPVFRFSASNESFCLNAGEQTTVTVTATSLDAAQGTYDFEVVGRHNFGESRAILSLKVESTGNSIELVTFNRNVCLGDNAELSVLVRNTSGSFASIDLSADSSLFVPVVSPKSLLLGPNEERFVTVEAALPSAISEGEYFVDVFADSGSLRVKKRVYFRAVDCAVASNPKFNLSLSPGCFSVQKGKSAIIRFSLESLSDSSQTVDLATESGLVVGLSEPVFLPAKETRVFDLNVVARKSDKTGAHDIALFAWSGDYKQKRTTCVNVRGVHDSAFELLGNDIGIARETNGVFTLRVSNDGDFDERYNLRISNPYRDISVDTLSQSFTVRAHESRDVFISVSALADAELGRRSLTLRVTGADEFVSSISFVVVESAESAEGFSLSSYPGQARLKQGEEQKLVFSFRNSRQETVEGVSTRLIGFPDGVTLVAGTVDVLPGQSKNVEAVLRVSSDVKPGTYNGTLLVKNREFNFSKPFTLYVEQAVSAQNGGNGGQNGPFSGFFTLGRDAVIGLIVLLALIVLIVLLAGALSPGRDEMQVWVKR
ncbi:MAG: hypothetical protein HY394_04410 [Candidatus Diapherotrites archaeon]|nr:hypothetical protein [Candidatus Diapherotrites archaeon]